MAPQRPAGRGLVVALALVGLLFGTIVVAPVRAATATYNVNTTGDAVDADLGIPSCATAEGKCSLRAAVMQANALDPGSGAHTINVPAGTYTLSLDGFNENAAKTGDLDVLRSVVIKGAGVGKTIIQGSAVSAAAATDRLFGIVGLNVELAISDATLRRGNVFSGSAVQMGDASNSLTLDRVAIASNVAESRGIINGQGTLLIRDSTFSQNSGTSAIYLVGGSLTIRRSTISGNDTPGGTILFGDASTGLIDRTTISGNAGDAGPGAALVVGLDPDDLSTLTLRNSTISGNDETAIWVHPSSALTIESATIAGNTGSGIIASTSTTARNTIVSGNSYANCEGTDPTSLGHNLETGTSCGFTKAGDIQNGTASLGSLRDNGGPTKTRALGTTSDARDAGAACPDIDQRGYSRPKDGDGDGTATCDIGAYEAAKVALVATPSPAPTASPEVTLEPTVEPTTAPATAAPTAEPPASPAATVVATEPPATAGPAASPAPSPQPEPAGSGDGGGSMLWIGIAIGAAVPLLLLLFLGQRRRGRPAAP